MGQTTTNPRRGSLADELAAVARRLRLADLERRVALALTHEARHAGTSTSQVEGDER